MTAVEETSEGLSVAGRAEAEMAISRLIEHGRPAFAIAVLAGDVPRINEQDGYGAGDRVLAALAHRLESDAGPSDQLFRWSATTFVIVSRSLRGVTTPSNIRGATTAVFAIWPEEEPHALFDRVDHYIASRLACG